LSFCNEESYYNGIVNKIDRAFKQVPRAHFLPESVKEDADLDIPLPIGLGQTNSQPTTVRRMLEWLDPCPDEKILDVGSGSGWTSALLSYLVKPKGRVIAVEKHPRLVEFGRDNCKQLGIQNVEFHQAQDVYGWPDAAPYDRILVSASAQEVPEDLIKQLKIGGRLVIPVHYDVLVIDKISDDDYAQLVHSGYSFVPLVE
jgi:protein-L-isoaspartate(D-aspartate) O-methyltransferase